jgi:hypothetical protein
MKCRVRSFSTALAVLIIVFCIWTYERKCTVYMVRVITCKLVKEGSSALAGPHTRSKDASSVSTLCCFHRSIRLVASSFGGKGGFVCFCVFVCQLFTSNLYLLEHRGFTSEIMMSSLSRKLCNVTSEHPVALCKS